MIGKAANERKERQDKADHESTVVPPTVVVMAKVVFTNAAKVPNVKNVEASKKVMNTEDFLKFAQPGKSDLSNKGRMTQENSFFLKLDGNKFKKELLDKKKAEGNRFLNMISKERPEIKGLIKMRSSKKKFTKPEKSEILNRSQAVENIVSHKRLARVGGNEFMAHI